MKFYKLMDADLPLIFGMKDSELKLYLWLNVRLPFADSKAIEIDTAKLAEEIGISQRSVQRALKSLKARKIFDFEVTKATIKRMATPVPPTQESLLATPMSEERQDCHPSDTDVVKTTLVSPTQKTLATPMSEERQDCHPNDTDVALTTPVSPTSLETFTQKGTDFSQTIQTKQTSLSDLREKIFENENHENSSELKPELKQSSDREIPIKLKDRSGDRPAKSPQTAQNSLEIAKGDKDFMDWAIRRSIRLNARNAEIHATTCLKRDEALALWNEYQRSQTRPQPLYLEFSSMAEYAAYTEKRREELLYGMAS
jgi:hypothetical protein